MCTFDQFARVADLAVKTAQTTSNVASQFKEPPTQQPFQVPPQPNPFGEGGGGTDFMELVMQLLAGNKRSDGDFGGGNVLPF